MGERDRYFKLLDAMQRAENALMAVAEEAHWQHDRVALEAERDALRGAVETVREWAEELTRVPAMLDPLSLSAEYGRAVLALLAAARSEASR